MQFGNRQAFFLLWLVFCLVIFYLWAFRSKARLIERFVQKGLSAIVADSFNPTGFWLKAAVLLTACFFCILALARPQWGFRWEQVKRKGVDIFIALDTSRSMLAEDFKPNRLERSKLAILDLLKSLEGDRVGLVAFAGSAFIQCPLTNDYNGFFLSLNDVDTNTIPRGGTSISSAIKEAIRGFVPHQRDPVIGKGGTKKYRVLIVISDGEDHEGDALAAASQAEKAGIRIYCVGIATPQGELIAITDEAGNKTFLKDREGRVVKSRLNETLLEKIALATGGGYVHARPTEFGLNLLYSERISRMEKREIESKNKKRFYERFQIPLAIALALLLLEPFIPERKGRLV
jgi:Ca-activated chloride channel family protein